MTTDPVLAVLEASAGHPWNSNGSSIRGGERDAHVARASPDGTYEQRRPRGRNVDPARVAAYEDGLRAFWQVAVNRARAIVLAVNTFQPTRAALRPFAEFAEAIRTAGGIPRCEFACVVNIGGKPVGITWEQIEAARVALDAMERR